ncbi:hypothetical protein DIU31_020965 [Mucilaginibacter rubeus]|uniref:Uncharacterized protein n=1 Tax=Mucilaginibacter rubeus TaxID=2027860 RepID=A0AAE6JI69_9SPHI|nr:MULTISPECIES: hypothetical protein [Mucilaginibacter]QEM05863.1 hypothetical protein DIU31_020965 [Mucilaginibacter rubeus]QEM18445.1 hypothetical protein DIU38_021180 [Mucilaginibacter gossypii]QTE45017.1 hypothetical protein J3L19_06540 [Mucilaginibacter rubeus]QTE51614.1 hypothetical protein J3L21_06515 [Mucilaginibacter rubeus]QTE63836.1 hypothetical protein J3L22_02070 [Mucilaginibacter rubeus]
MTGGLYYNKNSLPNFIREAVFVYLLHVLLQSPLALQLLLQLSKHVGLVHDFAHLVQWFILLLQQGVLANEILNMVNSITVVMKRNFFMIFNLNF